MSSTVTLTMQSSFQFPSRLTGSAMAAGIREPVPLEIIEESEPSVVVDEEILRFASGIAKFLQRLETISRPVEAEAPIEVEQDIWVQLKPKRVFTLNVEAHYSGRAKPKFFPDWVEDDE